MSSWKPADARGQAPLNGASQTGTSAPIFQRRSGGILPAKSGLFGADWGLSRVDRAFSGPIREQLLALRATGESRNCPENALFGPVGAFRAKPPFAKPFFGFPRVSAPTTPGYLTIQQASRQSCSKKLSRLGDQREENSTCGVIQIG